MKKMIWKLKNAFTGELSEDDFQKVGNADNSVSGRRSAAYRRHFEGYTSYSETDEKGRKRTYRVYTGALYTPDLSKGQQVGRKLLYSLIWAFCFADLMVCAMQNIGVNSMWYSALAQALSVGCLLWAALGLFSYLIAHETRTVGEWKASAGSLKKSLPTAAAAFAVNVLVNLGYLLCAERDLLWKQLLCVAAYLAGMMLLIIWNVLECAVKYTETQSGNRI